MSMIIDLTMEVSEKTPPFPGDPKAKFEQIASISKHGCNERRISINSHFSTHIDSPFHMLTNGKKLEEFPVATFIGEATIIDVRNTKIIKKEHLPKRLTTPIILFFTGHTQKISEANFFKNNPVLSVEAANEIIRYPIRIVGIDSFTPDNYPYTVHKILFNKNILILENLVNLKFIGKKCKLIVAPLNLTDADGAPARVFAEI